MKEKSYLFIIYYYYLFIYLFSYFFLDRKARLSTLSQKEGNES